MATSIVPGRMCFVYWLYDHTCKDPRRHGYIGVSVNPKQRRAELKYKKGWDYNMRILFTGSFEKCIAEEFRLRPKPDIGWNINSGGVYGKIYSEETRLRISGNQGGKVGQKLSVETRAKISASQKRRYAEALQSNRHSNHRR